MHGGADVVVPHQLLHGHHIGMDGQQVRGERVAQGVQAYATLGDARTPNGLVHDPAGRVLAKWLTFFEPLEQELLW